MPSSTSSIGSRNDGEGRAARRREHLVDGEPEDTPIGTRRRARPRLRFMRRPPSGPRRGLGARGAVPRAAREQVATRPTPGSTASGRPQPRLEHEVALGGARVRQAAPGRAAHVAVGDEVEVERAVASEAVGRRAGRPRASIAWR
jgi:hypothetical protein